jgi:Cu2+-exporting ATPase
VLDKTGTLTIGKPTLVGGEALDPAVLRKAAGLAASSRHPYARALADAAADLLGPIEAAPGVEETRGAGLSRITSAGEERLGSAQFVGVENDDTAKALWFRAPGSAPVGFAFCDALRKDAAETVCALQRSGYQVELLSGDSESRVGEAAASAGISTWSASVRPGDKVTRLEALKREGRRALMVGDGLNDAPALAAGYASLSPSSAVDISQMASDAIFQGETLRPIVEFLGVARMQKRMALQNFAIALAYNAVSVPLAMAGHVTPLIAALAMSTSSIAVTINALRLGRIDCPAKAPQL